MDGDTPMACNSGVHATQILATMCFISHLHTAAMRSFHPGQDGSEVAAPVVPLFPLIKQPQTGYASQRILAPGAWSCAVQVMRMPGAAPACGSSSQISWPPGPAASTMPSDTPNFILRGLRLATTTVSLPISCSGA